MNQSKIRCRANIGMLISKWYIQLCFTNIKWNIYQTSGWSTSFRQQNSIVQITQLHRIDSSPTAAAISGQHRDADIEIISKWHIHIGFTGVEIRYLSDIEWICCGNRIPSYFVVSISAAISAWHIALSISKWYKNGIFILDLPKLMSDIDGWYRVLNGIASYLYRLIATIILVSVVFILYS